MQYMLLIYDNEANGAQRSDSERQAYMQEYFKYTQELKESGAFVAGDALAFIKDASSVRTREGETVVTDGPFAETREQLGGYYLVDVETREEAEKWAAKIPTARHGTIEVRPVMVFD